MAIEYSCCHVCYKTFNWEGSFIVAQEMILNTFNVWFGKHFKVVRKGILHIKIYTFKIEYAWQVRFSSFYKEIFLIVPFPQ